MIAGSSMNLRTLRICAIIIVLLLALWSNCKLFQCFLFSDDFLTLDRIHNGFNGHPELLLQRLFSSWVNPDVALFYRPLVELTFICDYAIWKNNPLGYHLSNFFFYSCNVLAVLFLVEKICWKLGEKFAFLIAFLSAALFAAYPLHTEPVVWAVGRADLLAGVFVLRALHLSVENLQNNKPLGKAALVFFGLALFCKESAACMPAFIVVYRLLLSDRRVSFKEIIRDLLPFVLVTCFYLVARFFVLGSFLGGYTKSFGQFAEPWFWDRGVFEFNTFAMICMGLNPVVLKQNDFEVLALHVIFLLVAGLFFIRAFKKPWTSETSRLLLFFLAATLLSVLPAVQLLDSNCAVLQSRVFFLASAFFLPSIVIALVPTERVFESNAFLSKLFVSASSILLFLLSLTYSFVCQRDYQPWVNGSTYLLRLQQQVHDALLQLGPGRKLALVMLNSNIEGAPLVYSADEIRVLVGKLFYPGEDLTGRLVALTELPNFCPLSTDRMRHCLQHPEKYDLRMFESNTMDLVQLKAVKEVKAEPKSVLDKIVAARIIDAGKFDGNCHSYWAEFSEDSTVDDGRQIQLVLDWRKSRNRRMGELCLTSDMNHFPEKRYLNVSTSPNTGQKTVEEHRFSTLDLRSEVGSKATKYLYIRVSEGVVLNSAELIPASYCASLRPNSGVSELPDASYLATGQNVYFDMDASLVPDAASMELEVLKAGYLFETGKDRIRDPRNCKFLQKRIQIPNCKTQFAFPCSELEAGKHYGFRLVARDSNGNCVGYYSDMVYVLFYPVTKVAK